MNKESSIHKRQSAVKGKVDARGAQKKKLKLGCIGEPGRFRVLGMNMKCGVHHFST